MSEESVQNAEGNVVPGETTASDQHVEQASQHGWVSQEEWVEQGKDPDQWVDAPTFNMRGEFFDKIHKQKREMDEMRKALDDLKAMQARTAQVEREKVMRELKAAKKAAIEVSDGDAVIEIDERMEQLKDQEKAMKGDPEIQRAQQEGQRLFEEWTSENPWYEKDVKMRRYADSLGVELQQQGYRPDQIFQMVSEDVKKTFADSFENPRRKEASVAGTTGQKSASRSKGNWNQLSDEQKQAGQRFIKLGVFKDQKEYIEELAKSGAI